MKTIDTRSGEAGMSVAVGAVDLRCPADSDRETADATASQGASWRALLRMLPGGVAPVPARKLRRGIDYLAERWTLSLIDPPKLIPLKDGSWLAQMRGPARQVGRHQNPVLRGT